MGTLLDGRGQARLSPPMRLSACALTLLAVMPLALARPAHAAAPALPCTDFLALTARKPPHVIFTGCRLLPREQGKPMRATYHVDGRHAAAVEASLIRSSGLKRLRRSCCVWDAPSGWFTDKQGHGFSLTMASDETMIARRDHWRLIRRFTITIDAFTEEI